MNTRISIRLRWFGPVPIRNGRPLPRSQWARAGRRRKWCVRWYAPVGTRPRKTFETREEAEAFARELSARSEASGPQARIRPKRVTLGAFTDEFPKLGIGPRGEPLATASVNKHKRNLKSTFHVAVRQLRYLTFNPFTKLRQDRMPQKTLRYVSPKEFEKLIDAVRKRPHRALW